jgi:tripartite-type tricarboxylate transporter receptor subunit TctC
MDMNPQSRICGLGLLAVLAAPLFAQPYPAKTVRLISAFAAGGTNDYHARVLAQKLSGSLGQSVIVENRTGAGGTIGTDFVAKAAPDGYTLLMGFAGVTIAPSVYPRLPFDPVRDFTPVSLMCRIQNVLVVPPALPVRSVKELIALAKAYPGKLNYASTGVGSTPHLTGEMFKSLAGIQLAHVPYKGDSLALVDILGGQVEMMFSVLQPALVYVRSGKLRALAVTGERRTASLPDVLAMKEAGLPGYALVTWIGLIGPANLPREIVGKLNTAVVAAVAAKDIQEKLIFAGSDPESSTPEQFAQLVRDDVAKYAKIVKSAGIKPE